MKIKIWGSRGSLASAGPSTIRYGGNTVSVQVDGPDGSVLMLDAGTGIRRAGLALAGDAGGACAPHPSPYGSHPAWASLPVRTAEVHLGAAFKH
jgi:hypothetical protein